MITMILKSMITVINYKISKAIAAIIILKFKAIIVNNKNKSINKKFKDLLVKFNSQRKIIQN